MPIVTIVLRARNNYVDLGKSSQMWGCNFRGR
jgi:hypothetical protein